MTSTHTYEGYPGHYPTPSKIHTLSDMADVLNAHHTEYPIEWIEAVCEANGWRICDDSNEWSDYDICADGEYILFYDTDRNGKLICDTREYDLH